MSAAATPHWPGSRPLAVAAVAALAVLGGAVAAEAHAPSVYYNINIDMLEYERTGYADFDLVQMRLSIENLAGFNMLTPSFWLGGPPQYADHPEDNPNPPIVHSYSDSTYLAVHAAGGEVTVDDCIAQDRFSRIAPGETGETTLCFMVGKAFQPDGLYTEHTGLAGSHTRLNGGECSQKTTSTRDHSPPCGFYIQVIPFHADSNYCFDRNSSWCNADNVQPINGTTAPQPGPDPADGTPEPEQDPAELPAEADLLHVMYLSSTGTLVMAFDHMVIAGSPDRIQLIHDVDAFLEDPDSAPNLGDSELHTVDNKRQSMILAFALDGELRAAVAESLRMHGDLALVINERSVYSADGFVDVTDGLPLLVPDILVVR